MLNYFTCRTITASLLTLLSTVIIGGLLVNLGNINPYLSGITYFLLIISIIIGLSGINSVSDFDSIRNSKFNAQALFFVLASISVGIIIIFS